MTDTFLFIMCNSLKNYYLNQVIQLALPIRTPVTYYYNLFTNFWTYHSLNYHKGTQRPKDKPDTTLYLILFQGAKRP